MLFNFVQNMFDLLVPGGKVLGMMNEEIKPDDFKHLEEFCLFYSLKDVGSHQDTIPSFSEMVLKISDGKNELIELNYNYHTRKDLENVFNKVGFVQF